jgi:predicted TIM-barrel fold metal-dependent hydrolase
MSYGLKRREFVTAAACGLMGAAPRRIIDAHTHFYDPRRPQGVPWPPNNDAVLYQPTLPERYRKLVEPLGVTGTVVVEASPWLEDNQWILDLAKDQPSIVGFVGNLDPGAPEFASHLARFTKNPLFRGIRVGSRNLSRGLPAPAFVTGVERLAAQDLELDILGGPELFADVVRLSDRVPKLRVVINHLPYDWPRDDTARQASQTAFRELKGRPGVFAKVSGVLRRIGGRVPDDAAFYQASLDEVWEVFGADRVIYASNWPVSDKLAPYATVLKVVTEYFAAKGEEVSAKYFRGNSGTAYKWLDRRA